MNGRLTIIGAGVAGMTAAIHARASGFEVDVYEKHSIPGGLCTSWKMDGYLFDGCVEFFVGSGPSSPFYELWREVGVVPRPFVDRDVYADTVTADGRRVLLYADPDRLEAHLGELAPADGAVSAELCSLVRLMRKARYRVDVAPELMTVRDRLAAVAAVLPTMKLWRTGVATTVEAFAGRFSDPSVRAAVATAIPSRLYLLALVQVLGDLANRAAGSPVGGSVLVARSMARRCRELGVRLHLDTEVDRIVVRAGRAVGVRLASGEEHTADVVIAASDLSATLRRLLEGRDSPSHEALFRRPLVPSVCIISFGLTAPPPSAVDAVVHRWVLPRPVVIAGHEVSVLGWKTFDHDPSVAPRGGTVLTVTVESTHAPWAALQDDRRAYDERRRELGEGVTALLDQVLPGFAALVNTVDVATPVTVERYTHNHGGHYMTFLPRPGRPPKDAPRRVPGVDGLYLAGMWIAPPGGLPNALRSGRDVVQVLCRDHRVPFRPAA